MHEHTHVHIAQAKEAYEKLGMGCWTFNKR